MKLTRRSRVIRHTVLLMTLLVFVCRLAWSAADVVPMVEPPKAQLSQSPKAESELQKGIALSKLGHFEEAIPHFLAARGHVSDEYAASFNLALCYFGTNQFNQAIEVLNSLKNQGRSTPAVNNLLAQTYVAIAQPEKALTAFRDAVQETPLDEKLYLFIADACMDQSSYDLGLEIVNVGLQHLPHSARLHYERGAFWTFENEPDAAASDYEVAAKLAPKTDIAYMALGQNDLLKGDVKGAINVTRTAIKRGSENYILLAVFGDAVALSGVSPSQPLFAEAERALKKSTVERPHYAMSRLALGELLLSAGHLSDAVAQLEQARQLAPTDATVYSHLAIAYRREGHTNEELQMLSILSKLNEEHAQKYKGDSPNKAGYTASGHAPRMPSEEKR